MADKRLPGFASMLDAIARISANVQKTTPVNERISTAIGIAGQSLRADRVALFEFHRTDNTSLLVLSGEWCTDGTHPSSNGSSLTNIPFEDLGLERWRMELEEGRMISGTALSFPSSERTFFTRRGCTAAALCPVTVDDNVWGFLSIEYFGSFIEWADTVQTYLQTLSVVIGGIVASGRLGRHLERINNELYEIRVMRDSMAGELDEFKEWKGQIFSSFAHEFQTPLYTLLGFSATLLENEELDDDKEIRQTCLRHIYEQSVRLEKLVTEVMYSSRLQTRNYPLRLSQIELVSLLHDLEPMLHATTDRASVELILELPLDEITLTGDESLIRQLLVNLVESALATTPASGWISITLSYDDANAILSVTDSGTGIPPERLERVFEPFSQYSSLPSAAAGAGLGLSIARDIVDLHHGFITADSKVGEGTTFSVVLPRSQG